MGLSVWMKSDTYFGSNARMVSLWKTGSPPTSANMSLHPPAYVPPSSPSQVPSPCHVRTITHIVVHNLSLFIFKYFKFNCLIYVTLTLLNTDEIHLFQILTHSPEAASS